MCCILLAQLCCWWKIKNLRKTSLFLDKKLENAGQAGRVGLGPDRRVRCERGICVQKYFLTQSHSSLKDWHFNSTLSTYMSRGLGWGCWVQGVSEKDACSTWFCFCHLGSTWNKNIQHFCQLYLVMTSQIIFFQKLSLKYFYSWIVLVK